MAKRKSTERRSGKSNSPTRPRWQRGNKYSLGELFMAGLGALLIILVIGIAITSFLGD